MSQIFPGTKTVLPPSDSCSFSAAKTSVSANVTGDGTPLNPVVFDNELFADDGDCYDNTTGVFTCPFDGNYFFTTQIGFANLISAHTYLAIEFVISGQFDFGTTAAAFALANPGGVLRYSTYFATMLSEGDTVWVAAAVSNGTKTVSVTGVDTSVQTTTFTGFLM